MNNAIDEPLAKGYNMSADTELTNKSGLPKDILLKQLFDAAAEPSLNMALLIASWALLHKKTWAGSDYSEHWLWVGRAHDTDIDIEARIIGILHDVVEDSDWTIEDLEKLGFSDVITGGVRAVTKMKGELYLDATRRCSSHPKGRRVKRRDNKHNMDTTRALKTPTQKQAYLYPVSYAYLRAVEDGEISPGASIWRFLQMDKYKNFLTQDSVASIKAATLDPMPPHLAALFQASKPKRVQSGGEGHPRRVRPAPL